MQNTYVWHQLNLHRNKIIFALVLLCCAFQSEAQQKVRWVRKNNPNYDEKRLTYGFLIGLHTTAYQINYSDQFVNRPDLDTLHSVTPDWSPGFALGFIVNYRISEFFDIRITPEVAFYENKLRYQNTNRTYQDQLIETTMVEFPILLKYKSERRDNIRMYMIGGLKPGFDASGKKKLEQLTDALEVSSTNLSLEAGLGFDLYFPLFKFSPELRYSRGLLNMLDNTTNIYGQPLQRINTNTITLYLLFQ
ncbi:MAG TPA: porin family protein [Chryseolinea sp.]|nr:porin family protein [Chryseolinea sp.]